MYEAFGMNCQLDMSRTYIEEEIHEKLMKAFMSFKPVKQYRVLNYKIDLYFPTCSVAIECDEYAHKEYNRGKEVDRESRITKELDCKWIRYDPYSLDFDIFLLIDRINSLIIQIKQE